MHSSTPSRVSSLDCLRGRQELGDIRLSGGLYANSGPRVTQEMSGSTRSNKSDNFTGAISYEDARFFAQRFLAATRIFALVAADNLRFFRPIINSDGCPSGSCAR